MRGRRRVLRAAAVLAALGASPPGPARAALAAAAASAAASGAASVPPVLVWGPDGTWIVGPGGARALPAALPPAATAGGVWCVDAQARVTRWPVAAPPAGTSASHRFDEPVHALAASADGAHALVAHGERLTLLDAQAIPLRVYDGTDLARMRRGSADWLCAHAGRRSLLASWPALGELWEIPLDPDAAPIYDGLVHDYRMGEALPSRGHLGVRRAPLGRPMPRWGWADTRVPWVAGWLDAGVAIVHLDVRRRIATLPLPQAQLPAAALRESGARHEWWLPAGDAVQLVDPARWTVIAQRPLPPGLVALRAAGAEVWAFGDAGLQRWDGERWQAPPGRAHLPGIARAFERDAARGHWLVATDDPPALHRLHADGRPLARLAWPDGARIDGVAALG